MSLPAQDDSVSENLPPCAHLFYEELGFVGEHTSRYIPHSAHERFQMYVFHFGFKQWILDASLAADYFGIITPLHEHVSEA